MSYIFEALQRAEAERSGGNPPQNADSVVDMLEGLDPELSVTEAQAEPMDGIPETPGAAAVLPPTVEPEVVRCLIDRSTANQKPLQLPAASRRGRGRPRDEEFDKYTFDRFIVLRSAARVAEEAANQFGGTADAALKRIKREPWYQSMAPAVAIPKHKPTPSPQPADGSKRVPICQSRRKREPASRPMGTTSQAPGGSTDSQRPKELGGAAHDQQLGDAIEKHIRVHGPREPEQFVSELGLALLDVVGALQHQARFRCLPGNRYGLR